MQTVELTRKGTEFLLRDNHLAMLWRILVTYESVVRDKERNKTIIWWSMIMVFTHNFRKI